MTLLIVLIFAMVASAFLDRPRWSGADRRVSAVFRAAARPHRTARRSPRSGHGRGSGPYRMRKPTSIEPAGMPRTRTCQRAQSRSASASDTGRSPGHVLIEASAEPARLVPFAGPGAEANGPIEPARRSPRSGHGRGSGPYRMRKPTSIERRAGSIGPFASAPGPAKGLTSGCARADAAPGREPFRRARGGGERTNRAGSALASIRTWPGLRPVSVAVVVELDPGGDQREAVVADAALGRDLVGEGQDVEPAHADAARPRPRHPGLRRRGRDPARHPPRQPLARGRGRAASACAGWHRGRGGPGPGRSPGHGGAAESRPTRSRPSAASATTASR
jgi:hypothetical protein